MSPVKSDRLTAGFKYALAAVAALSLLAAGYAGMRSRRASPSKVIAAKAAVASADQAQKVIALESYVPPGVPVALTNAVALIDKTDNPAVDGPAQVRFNVAAPGGEALASLSLALFEFDGNKLRRVQGWLRNANLSPTAPAEITLDLNRRLKPGGRTVLAVERASGQAGTWETAFADLATAVAGGKVPVAPAVNHSAEPLPDDYGAAFCADALRRAMALKQVGDRENVTSLACDRTGRTFGFTYNGKSLTQ